MAKETTDTIHILTELSRIGCPEEEQEAFLEDLNHILSYMEQLQEFETEGVEPCNHVIEGMKNVMREDVVGETMPRKTFLGNASDQVGGLIRVPPVIHKNG